MKGKFSSLQKVPEPSEMSIASA